VVRVHRNILARQQLPPALVTKNIWRERFDDINAYERYLSRQMFFVTSAGGSCWRARMLRCTRTTSVSS
jgi:hypothetical protein